jgi:uncharacterized protein (DUF4415 family)
MPTVRRKLVPGAPVSAKVKRNLKQIDQIRDAEIDTSDIPEWTDEMFAQAERSRFYRPKKTRVTLLLDADLLAWLKASGAGYQTRINAFLREQMRSQVSRKAYRP